MSQVESNTRIAKLNDDFRNSFLGGTVLLTSGIRALSEDVQQAILTAVRAFSDFYEDNDPCGEHDFGSFQHEGKVINWKIDYYDSNLQFGSEDPANPAITQRVLTVMLAEEY